METKISACIGLGENNEMNPTNMNNYCNIPQAKCSLAMAYVPWQKWEAIFEDEKAFMVGTAFPSLDLPFCGKGISE